MTGQGFCPQCGTQRQGSLRFCASCGFDFWKAAESQAASSTSVAGIDALSNAPEAKEPQKRRPWLLWGGAALAAILLVGAIGSALGGGDNDGAAANPSSSTDATARERPTEKPATRPTQRPTARPTPIATPAGPRRVAVGETVQITCGSAHCLDVTVSDPSEHAVYPGQYYNDEPQQTGWVFMQVYVKYVSTQDGSTYNQFDWAIYADGRQLDSWAFASEGPEPEIGSGTLPNGRTAEGWLLYEVPPSGEIVLSYEPNFDGPPVFEVVLRAS